MNLEPSKPTDNGCQENQAEVNVSKFFHCFEKDNMGPFSNNIPRIFNCQVFIYLDKNMLVVCVVCVFVSPQEFLEIWTFQPLN